MAETSSKVLEGVFAVSKPPSLSSAQVLRDLQHIFAKSKTFAPLLDRTRAQKEEHKVKRRRFDRDNVFKMGHGGTLDPLATGVLIVGIGRGTKCLQNFLDCTKTYETVVLFGKETDTYDIAGKIVEEAPFGHITKEMVEQKLSAFRGHIKQAPPLYSALKINGMKAYEYARSGKELPRELKSRDMEVTECTLIDWYEAGEHDYRWPSAEAPPEEKSTVRELIESVSSTNVGVNPTKDTGATAVESEEAAHTAGPVSSSNTATSPITGPKLSSPSGQILSVDEINALNALPPAEKAALHKHDVSNLASAPANAPAARVRLTVSSGFYVRSFAHDLGLACDSLGTMAELSRNRQADYTILDPAPDGLVTTITIPDLEKGEEVWGPKVSATLNSWLEQNPVADHTSRPDDRDAKFNDKRKSEKNRGYDKYASRPNNNKRPRRNSSSPEA